MTLPLMKVDDPESRAATRIAVLNLGFRPFFLLAGISAVLLIPLWIFFYTRGQIEFGYYTALYWHGHVMLFGCTAAVIAFFLLTAVRNWTDMPTPGGKALAGLVLLWLAGRVAPFTAGGIGTVTLGMMARVAPGHTGRVLRVGTAMFRAFVLANLAGVVRVLLPPVTPSYYEAWLVLAAILWSTAFTIFVIVYANVLISPRIDGRPG